MGERANELEVDRSIRREVEAAFGEYEGVGLHLSLALQFAAGAMTYRDPTYQRASVRNALDQLRKAGLVIPDRAALALIVDPTRASMTARDPIALSDASIERAARILPVAVAEMKADNDTAVIERCIRDNGREFEYGYRCDADPAKAQAKAEAVRKRIDYVRSPSVRQVSPTEWSVKYWSAD